MTQPDDPTGPADRADQVGSLAEEAGKLFGALSDWARDSGSDVGQGFSGLADVAATRAAEVADGVDEHLATGAAECTYCPICRTVHVVRQTSPEVRAHLASAASSLLQAAAGILATAVPADARSARTAGVEKIDLDDGTETFGTDPDSTDPDWPEEHV